jgi:hypothetical protein
MTYPRIEWQPDPKGYNEHDLQGMFWDPAAEVEVMPQEVALRYNEAHARLSVYDTAAQEVAKIVQSVSSAVGYQVSPTGRTVLDPAQIRTGIHKNPTVELDGLDLTVVDLLISYAMDRGLATKTTTFAGREDLWDAMHNIHQRILSAKRGDW